MGIKPRFVAVPRFAVHPIGGRVLFCCLLASCPIAQSAQAPQLAPQEEFNRINRTIETVCGRYPRIEPELLWALVWQESKHDADAVGRDGEIGPGQVLPSTALGECGKIPVNLDEQLDCAARILTRRRGEFKDLEFALAAYNAGSGYVRSCLNAIKKGRRLKAGERPTISDCICTPEEVKNKAPNRPCVPLSTAFYADFVKNAYPFAKRTIQYAYAVDQVEEKQKLTDQLRGRSMNWRIGCRELETQPAAPRRRKLKEHWSGHAQKSKRR